MAKGEGGGGNWAERQASRKPIKKVSVDAGSDAIVRAIVKPKAKPVAAKKRKVVPLPRAKPSQPAMPRAPMDFRQLPGSAAGLRPRVPGVPPSLRGYPAEPVRRPVQTDSDPGTVYPVPTGVRGGREDVATFGNWDIAQQAQGQDLLGRIQRYTTQRNLDQGNLNTQRIKRRGLPISSLE